MRALLFFKTFPGHSGRPGLVGGSAKRAPAGEDGGGEASGQSDAFIPGEAGQVDLGVIGMRDRPRPFTAGKDSAVLSRFNTGERPGRSG